MFKGKVPENQNTHFMFNDFVQICAVYNIMQKNEVETDGPQMTT